jgi:hypothetical protein
MGMEWGEVRRTEGKEGIKVENLLRGSGGVETGAAWNGDLDLIEGPENAGYGGLEAGSRTSLWKLAQDESRQAHVAQMTNKNLPQISPELALYYDQNSLPEIFARERPTVSAALEVLAHKAQTGHLHPKDHDVIAEVFFEGIRAGRTAWQFLAQLPEDKKDGLLGIPREIAITILGVIESRIPERHFSLYDEGYLKIFFGELNYKTLGEKIAQLRERVLNQEDRLVDCPELVELCAYYHLNAGGRENSRQIKTAIRATLTAAGLCDGPEASNLLNTVGTMATAPDFWKKNSPPYDESGYKDISCLRAALAGRL